MIGLTTLGQLPLLRSFQSRRASSYDTTGGNQDWWVLEAGETRRIMESDKPGCIRHIWMTVGEREDYLRGCIVRMWWDSEESPSVEVPLGDFFGLGHGMRKPFTSLPLQFSPEEGRAMNCWWPMPFDGARIEVTNECEGKVHLYFYVDYEEYGQPHGADVARFHAQWRREACTEGWLTERLGPENYMQIWDSRKVLSDEENYVILEATGSGVYVGCHLDIDCFQRQGNDWYGEGDDMIVIDGEPWPPRLHGTGTEDYFCTAFGPRQEFSAPYHGLPVYSGTDEWPYKGKNSMYRYHIEDPVRFEKSIRVSIEHGSSNKLFNDYSSTAYWYQLEPHAPFPKLLDFEARKPRPNEPTFP